MGEDLAPLPPGTPAPAFTLPRTAYESFALEDARGRSLVLVFYPGDWEPVSGDQLARYQAYAANVDRLGAMLVGISVDSVWSHLAFARERGLNFPLLSDFEPKGAVARAYGVYREAEGWSGRALFVIDGGGVIRWSRAYPTNLNPGVDGVLTALERVQVEGEP
jgi:peroxiredoxin